MIVSVGSGWSTYYVELWIERKEENLKVEIITGRYGICR
jgi:hypothetical protein